jgi:hypothetical protein
MVADRVFPTFVDPSINATGIPRPQIFVVSHLAVVIKLRRRNDV